VTIHQNSSNCLLDCAVRRDNCHPKGDTFAYTETSASRSVLHAPPRRFFEPEGGRLNYDIVDSRLLEV